MVLTKVFCFKCGSPREEFELLCNTCNSPFIIRVSGPYEKKTQDNFDYIEKPLFPMDLRTPLIKTDLFSAKLEYFNPTLSYKDRGMNTLFSFLREKKYITKGEQVSEDSSGNAGASFALFSKMLDLKPTVFASKSANANKLKQIESYGSKIKKIEGSRKDVEDSARNSGMKYLGHQYWPEFYDGFRAISYEIFEQMEKLPDNILIPFSTGTLYLGIFEGFSHLLQNGLIESMPALWALQPERASGMYNMLNNIAREPSSSIADALTGVLPLRHTLLSSIIKTYGRCETLTEDEIIQGKKDLAKVGIDCEYSSAITYSALRKFNLNKNSLLILTGHGIKNI
ncbi:MAG: pyridoxal-phosphate dependent enzyme [Candidatus Thermoplasmatota archaeon]|nr:pyridoxal-phosphate dependent enzyme [Candidatus Thermoplasmatota archaeon]